MQGKLGVFCALIQLQMEVEACFPPLLAEVPGPTWSTQGKSLCLPAQHQHCSPHHSDCLTWLETGLGLCGAGRLKGLQNEYISLEQNGKILEKVVHSVFNGRMKLLLICRAQSRDKAAWMVQGAAGA